MRHTFESGEWIELRPVSNLKAKDKDVYAAAVKLYVEFDDSGKPDMSSVPFSMSIPAIQRDALLARLMLGGDGWSFTTDGGDPLPVPVWNEDLERLENHESIGELPLDDWNELEALLQPYIDKVKIKPSPKPTTTENSTGTSRRKGGAPYPTA